MAPGAIVEAPPPSGRNSPKPAPKKSYSVNDPPFEGFRPIDAEGYARSDNSTAIVIDNGEPVAQTPRSASPSC